VEDVAVKGDESKIETRKEKAYLKYQLWKERLLSKVSPRSDGLSYRSSYNFLAKACLSLQQRGNETD
jgi:hypothetical protein